MKKLSSALIVGLLAFTACFGSSTAVAAPTLNTNYVLENKERVSRALFDYTYKVTITNTEDSPITNVKATAQSHSADLTITQAEVSFPDIAVGETAEGTTTFTLRKDRLVPFNPDNLTWDISYDTFVIWQEFSGQNFTQIFYSFLRI